MNSKTTEALPRTLVLSFSGIGSDTATGQLLNNLFARWPDHALLQVYWGHPAQRNLFQIDAASQSGVSILQAIEAFEPDIIYLRPADTEPRYSKLAGYLIEQLDLPLVTHTMDDWSVRIEDQPDKTWMLEDLARHYRAAQINLTISEEMSAAYRKDFALNFEALANGIDPSVWLNQPQRPIGNPFTIRYCGALADDMHFQSVMDVAEAVQQIAEDGTDVRFEIYTNPWFMKAASSIASNRSAVSIQHLVPIEDYPGLLASSDAVLLCYNFDPASIRYTRFSFANKTPECLASGSPVIAYGPAQIPSIGYIQRHDLGVCITTRGDGSLLQHLRALATGELDSTAIAQRARKFALQHHDLSNIQNTFEQRLRSCANSSPSLHFNTTREDDVQVEETEVVGQFFSDQARTGTMLDVGAHVGSSLSSFLERGWQVHAFEPDPNNRSELMKNWPQHDRLIVSSQAVGNRSNETLELYAANQSSGISSLVPFHERHKPTATVQTIRLDDYCAANNIHQVEFLKVDTEGYDLRVLEGFPWQRMQPDVVVCEYEDSKTQSVGYTHEDLARFLEDRGYQVFLSEWHPIVRYGIRHQWRRVKPWPQPLQSSQSWGNFIAFREPVSPEYVEALFARHILAHRAAEQTVRVQRTCAPFAAPILNHLRIFRGFSGSTQGLITLALLLVIAIASQFAFGSLLGTVISTLAGLHAVAYTVARVSEEKRHRQTKRHPTGDKTFVRAQRILRAFTNGQRVGSSNQPLAQLDRLAQDLSSLRDTSDACERELDDMSVTLRHLQEALNSRRR